MTNVLVHFCAQIDNVVAGLSPSLIAALSVHSVIRSFACALVRPFVIPFQGPHSHRIITFGSAQKSGGTGLKGGLIWQEAFQVVGQVHVSRCEGRVAGNYRTNV